MTEAEINQILEIYKKYYPEHYKALCDALAESVRIVKYIRRLQNADSN